MDRDCTFATHLALFLENHNWYHGFKKRLRLKGYQINGDFVGKTPNLFLSSL